MPVCSSKFNPAKQNSLTPSGLTHSWTVFQSLNYNEIKYKMIFRKSVKP